MKVVVFGLGKSGRSACAFLQRGGHEIIASDDKVQEAPSGARFVPSDVLVNELDGVKELDGVDLLIISPGVPLTHPVARAAKERSIEVICDVEFAFRQIQEGHLVGITGSNGKTTTTMLTCHMLEHAQLPAKAVGNIGSPLLDELDSTKKLVVELSSFQLETMKTRRLDAACILNITPNHLDRHTSFEEYQKAKLAIFGCVNEGGECWLHERSAVVYRDALLFGFSPASDLYSDGEYIVRFGNKEAKLPKELQNSFSHNTENFLAAYALCRQYDVAPDLCVEAYTSFVKPKHRIEYVKTIQGRHFYDDSKATSVDAVLRAVESLPNQIVLIAGGVHKGYPYTSWQKSFQGKVRKVLLIGKATPFIEQDLAGSIETEACRDLEHAVERAMQISQDQDVILLSPGCSSYDMFTSFEERGLKFQELVQNL